MHIRLQWPLDGMKNHLADHNRNNNKRRRTVRKKLYLVLGLLLAILIGWTLLNFNDINVTIYEPYLYSLSEAASDAWEFVCTAVILFWVGILLAFVFTGVGLIVLGSLVLVGLILAVVAFPFLLPLLIPLFIIWIVYLLQRKNRTKRLLTHLSAQVAP
jgi:hypothetical protein